MYSETGGAVAAKTADTAWRISDAVNGVNNRHREGVNREVMKL